MHPSIIAKKAEARDKVINDMAEKLGHLVQHTAEGRQGEDLLLERLDQIQRKLDLLESIFSQGPPRPQAPPPTPSNRRG